MITHLAFYAGWPAAMTAGRVAADRAAAGGPGRPGAGAP
jgi:alkylhydroperoxidase/carboxymuconolactone decarboxylase family protein YurZ